MVCGFNCGYLWCVRILGNCLDISSWVSAVYILDYFKKFIFLLYKLICYWALHFIRSSNISSHNYWKKPLYSRTIQFGTLGSLCWNHCCCLGSLYCRSTVFPSGAKYDCSRNEWVGGLVFQNLKVDVIFLDYSVVIIMGVFVFASLSWLLSARHWFIGPVRTIDETSSQSSLQEEKSQEK